MTTVTITWKRQPQDPSEADELQCRILKILLAAAADHLRQPAHPYH